MYRYMLVHSNAICYVVFGGTYQEQEYMKERQFLLFFFRTQHDDMPILSSEIELYPPYLEII